jgi:restriction system protein
MAVKSYYHIAIQHPGLNKHRVIRGNDKYLVEAAAATQHRAWAEQYARKVEVDDRRRERDDKRQEIEDNLREADERTVEAQALLKELRGVLVATLRVDDRVNWESLMQPPFSQMKPREREFVQLSPEPVFNSEDWKKRRNFVTSLLPFLAKRAEAAANAEFVGEYVKWRTRTEAAKTTNN